MLYVFRRIFILAACLLVCTQFLGANSQSLSATAMQNIIFKFHPFLKERTLSNGMNSLLLNVNRRKRHRLNNDRDEHTAIHPVSTIAIDNSILETKRLWGGQNEDIYLYENVLEVPVKLNKRHIAFETYAKTLETNERMQKRRETSKSEPQNITNSISATDHLSSNVTVTPGATTGVMPVTTKTTNALTAQPGTTSVVKRSRKRNIEATSASINVNHNWAYQDSTRLRRKLQFIKTRTLPRLTTATKKKMIRFKNPPTVLCMDKLGRRNVQSTSITARISTITNAGSVHMTGSATNHPIGTQSASALNTVNAVQKQASATTSVSTIIKTLTRNAESTNARNNVNTTGNKETRNAESTTVTNSMSTHNRNTESTRSTNGIYGRNAESISTIKSISQSTNVERRNTESTTMDGRGNLEIGISIRFNNVGTNKVEFVTVSTNRNDNIKNTIGKRN